MEMKMRNTLILFVILLGLALYVYLVEIKQHEKKEIAEKESKKLFTLVQDSLEALRFRNTHGSFALKRIQNQWRITQPLYTEAEESTVNTMLSSLLETVIEAEFPIKKNDLGNYGLGRNALSVQVGGRGGIEDSIRFGDKTPVGAFIFSSKSDSQVVTINQSVKTNFEKTLFDIRDKKLLHFKRDDVRKITLHNPHGTYTFEKAETPDWKIVNLDRPADNSKISNILSKLENNRVKSFVDEEGEKRKAYGLSAPQYQIDLMLAPDQGQKKFLISRNINDTYFARDDSRKPIFEIDSMLVKDVAQKISEFRNKDLVSFDRNEVNRLTFKYGDTLFSCVKDTADNWFLNDLAGDVLIKQKIVSFFSNLDYTNIADFVKDGNINVSDYGLLRPVLSVSLYRDSDLLVEVKLGSRKEKNIHVMTNQYDSVYLIPDTKLKDFKLKMEEILEKPVDSMEGLESDNS